MQVKGKCQGINWILLEYGENHSASSPVSSSESEVEGMVYHTESNDAFLYGILHKIPDGKWTRSSWHKRWFLLDKNQAVLHYYKYDPLVNHNRTVMAYGVRHNGIEGLYLYKNNIRCINDQHALYRGCMDLNHADTGLLFEKRFGKFAPTKYIFQVTRLRIGQIEEYRGAQYKVIHVI